MTTGFNPSSIIARRQHDDPVMLTSVSYSCYQLIAGAVTLHFHASPVLRHVYYRVICRRAKEHWMTWWDLTMTVCLQAPWE